MKDTPKVKNINIIFPIYSFKNSYDNDINIIMNVNPKYKVKSNKNVPNQYGIGLHPIATNAYFKLVSLSNTGYIINNDELKQNAIITNKEKNIILAILAPSLSLPKSISPITIIPVTINPKGIIIAK